MTDRGESDILKTMMASLIIGVIGISLLGSPILSGVADEATHTDLELVDGRGDLNPGVLNQVENVTSVKSTLGDQAALTGANDSHITLDESIDVGPNWSACTYGSAAQSAVDGNETRELLAVDYLTLRYNGSDDVWRAWYFDQGDRQWYSADVAASAPADNTLVCGAVNATHLTISRNTTVGAAVALSGGGAGDPPAAANWNGTVEETRVLNVTINGTQRQAYVDQPVISVPGEPAAARIMYDVRDGNRGAGSVPAYFADGAYAQLSNASLVDGFGGPTLDQGTDYRVATSSIVALDGGALDGDGDVVFVTWFGSQGFGTTYYLVGIGIALFIITPLASKLLEGV